MAITVKLTDGMVKVGGDFDSALGWIKSFNSRAYNGTTKTWTIPTTVKEFCDRGHYPMDIISGNGSNRYSDGNHVTRYGNSYSRDEWDAMREAEKAGSDARKPYEQKMIALKEQFRAKLSAIGVSDQGQTHIIAHWYELETMEEYGKIKFSTPERRTKVYEALNWYEEEWTKLADAADDAASSAQTIIYEKYGAFE